MGQTAENEEAMPDRGVTAARADKETRAKAHRMPFGAELRNGGTVRFRLFAPDVDSVALALEDQQPVPMESKGEGWYELVTGSARAGSRYRFLLPDGTRVPDPASRHQPVDVAGPSEVVDPAAYLWRDAAWRGRRWEEAVLYELHVGTFTPAGTFESAIEKLDYLRDVGITAIELMCLFDFAGNRNWGYDGVLPYAPDSAYGTPDDVRAFVDAAHGHGIMVIVDVVYNHFGPEGNFLSKYFKDICSETHDTPWGKSLNFDGRHCKEVREFVIQNALYWVEEFHMDGLRLDASHAMVDDSPQHILDELQERVRALDCGRPVYLILENDTNVGEKLKRGEHGELLGYTAQWNHDTAHLLGAALADYCDEKEAAKTHKVAEALADGFVLAAEDKAGGWIRTAPPTAFVSFIQTHDLVGNRVFGDRVFASAAAESVRAIACVYLLGPQIPMLFMGEEWGASTPFPFFCDYHGELAEAVRKGRCADLRRLDASASDEDIQHAPDPQAESTLRSAQLKWDEVSEPSHAAWLEFYKRMLKLRREEIVPMLAGLNESCGEAAEIGRGAFTITWQLARGAKLHLAANLCKQPRGGFPVAAGRVFWEQGDVEEGELGPWAVRWSVESGC